MVRRVDPPPPVCNSRVLSLRHRMKAESAPRGTKEAGYQPEAAVVHGIGAGAIPDEHRNMVKRAVVFIETPVGTNSVSRGTGFIAELAVNGKNKCLLITCNHVLPSLSDALKSDIFFGRVGTSDKGTKINGQELFQSQFFKTDAEDCTAMGKRKLDYSAVEVKFDVMRIKLQNNPPRPLPLTKSAEVTEGLSVGDMLYIVHYPKEPIPYIRYENAEQICLLLGPYIGHIATAFQGSSGSPMLRECNSEWVVVGLHRCALGEEVNLATLVTEIVNDIQDKPYTGEVPDSLSFAKAARENLKSLAFPQHNGRGMNTKSALVTALPSVARTCSPSVDLRGELLSSKPTAALLMKKVVPAVAHMWHSLGVRLGMEVAILNAFKTTESRSVELCCLEMFECWLHEGRGTGVSPRTWSTVLSVIGDCLGHDVASRTEEALLEERRRAMREGGREGREKN